MSLLQACSVIDPSSKTQAELGKVYRESEDGISLFTVFNKQRSIYQYSTMVLRLSGQTSIFGVVFFVSKSLLRIEGQKKLYKNLQFCLESFRAMLEY